MHFIPQFNVNISTQVTSNALTIPNTVTGSKTVTLSPSGYAATFTTPQLLKNGSVVASPTTVVAGDTIAIRGTTGATYEAAYFAAVLIQDVGYFAFGAINRQNPTTDSVPLSKYTEPLAPFDPYTGITPNNRILFLDPSSNAITPFALANVAGQGPQNDGLPYIFAPNYVDDVVQRINTSGEVVQSVAGEGPYSVAYSPIYSPATDTPTHTLITAPKENKVRVYHGNSHTFEYEVSVNSPYGVAGTGTANASEYGFWVTSRDTDKVSYFKYSGSSATLQFETTLEAGSLPTALVVDGSNCAYVVCTGTDKIAKVFLDGTTPTFYMNLTAGSKPTNITINEFKTHAYVFCSNSTQLPVITLTTNAVTILSAQKYLSCGVVANSRLYVGSIYSNVFGYYPLTSDTAIGAYVSLSTSYRLIEGMTLNLDRTQIYVLVQHEDNPTLITSLDKTPDGLPTVLTHYAETLVAGTVVNFESQLVSGLDASTVFRLPSYASANVVRNGTASGTAVVMSNSDTFNIRNTIPANGLPVSMPLMFTGGYIVLNTSLQEEVLTRALRVAGYMRGG